MLSEKQPPERLTPPANVDVDVFVTTRFVAVVEPSCERPETERAVEVAPVNNAFVV